MYYGTVKGLLDFMLIDPLIITYKLKQPGEHDFDKDKLLKQKLRN